MDKLIAKYARKIVAAGLAEPGAPLLGGLDAKLVWTRPDPATAELAKVFSALTINSLLFCRPASPYREIVDFLAAGASEIMPEDCETRTFLHDLPVARALDAKEIIAALGRRKSVIIPGQGIVAHGTVSPEQAFVSFSSVLFACFVKFFVDTLAALEAGEVSPARQAVFDLVRPLVDAPLPSPPRLRQGPFESPEEVYAAIAEAGAATVAYGLVDSFFGNISYYSNDILYISQTGGSLDELPGHIDPCPLDGSSCAGLTASSEFPAHAQVILTTKARAILHGHPKFSVIMSMHCHKKDCPGRGQCHVSCETPRFLGDIPVVTGEVGTGPTGLCQTMPKAMAGSRGVMVHGHGLFAIGQEDFNVPFATMLGLENDCRQTYFEAVDAISRGAGA